MANRNSRIVIPVRAVNFDGRYWGDFPNGDKPNTGAILQADALGRVGAAGQLSTAIRLGAGAQDVAAGSGGLSSGIKLAGAAQDVAAASATFPVNNLIAPASGLQYQNRVFTDLNYASNSAALTAGIVTELSDGGTGVTRWSWAADPENAAIKCFKTTYVNNEDNAQCRVEFGPGKYVYFQWDEYWDPAFSSASSGKANRLMSPSSYPSNYSDHIYYGAPGNSTYGFVMQGADTYDVHDADRTGRSPALPKGQWVTMAVEHYVTSGNTGYAKLWQKVGSTWTLLPLDFTDASGSFVTNQPYFIGKTSSDDTRKYGRAVVGGWVSGVTPGASDNRWLKNMLILWNDSTAPT